MMRGRWRPLGLAILIAGCGHDVEPDPDYADPASIPVCCESDPGVACCGLVAFGFAGGIQVDWNAEDTVFRYVDGWYLYRAEGAEEPPAEAYRRLNSMPYVYRGYLDRDIENGAHYWYRLTSVSPAGVESLPTPAVDARPDFTAPTTPTGLVATVVGGDVELAWTASPEADLDHYNVFRDPPFPPFVFPRAPGPRYVDGYVEPDSTYRYWVTAVDMGFNESAPSETVTVKVVEP